MPLLKNVLPSGRLLALVLTVQLGAGGLSGQNAGFLKLTPIDGDGAFNDVKHRIGHAPTVRVVDESNNIVQGAEVTFVMPLVGPRGIFADGARSATAVTDDKGIAQCPAFKPNPEEGRFNIKVSASLQGKTGTLTISQSNTLAGGVAVKEQKKSKAMLVLLLLGGGGGAGAAVALSHRGSQTPAAPSPTTLSAGTVTVGGPR